MCQLLTVNEAFAFSNRSQLSLSINICKVALVNGTSRLYEAYGLPTEMLTPCKWSIQSPVWSHNRKMCRPKNKVCLTHKTMLWAMRWSQDWTKDLRWILVGWGLCLEGEVNVEWHGQRTQNVTALAPLMYTLSGLLSFRKNIEKCHMLLLFIHTLNYLSLRASLFSGCSQTFLHWLNTRYN